MFPSIPTFSSCVLVGLSDSVLSVFCCVVLCCCKGLSMKLITEKPPLIEAFLGLVFSYLFRTSTPHPSQTEMDSNEQK